MKTESIGLYVHIPMCIKKCNYCDFCSYPERNAEWRDRYIDTLCSEIDGYKGKNLSVNTVFFGGGTPSLLSESELEKICSHITKSFSVDASAEFTLEANPKTLTREKLKSYMLMGVNRLSMGVQSIHENELKILGRIHNYSDFLESYSIARKCGIDNINLDLMYGIPNQTLSSFEMTLDKILSLSPEHISLYGLILEEGTPFFKMKDTLDIPEEDAECDMYYLAVRKLFNSGYSHYEISNYSKPGYECRHNLKYWHNESYVGVGVSAYSYLNGVRFGNSSEIDEYLSCDREKYILREANESTENEAFDYVMLGLRLSEGISLSDYKKRFGIEFLTEERNDLIKEYSKLGMVDLIGDRLRLTDKGLYISNRILTDLL